jgi:hypothetical protein
LPPHAVGMFETSKASKRGGYMHQLFAQSTLHGNSFCDVDSNCVSKQVFHQSARQCGRIAPVGQRTQDPDACGKMALLGIRSSLLRPSWWDSR